ncbi:MAG: hypothetical protein RIS64_282 [Bacteroidota bacterium]|jgi:hypothetical protein
MIQFWNDDYNIIIPKSKSGNQNKNSYNSEKWMPSKSQFLLHLGVQTHPLRCITNKINLL